MLDRLYAVLTNRRGRTRTRETSATRARGTSARCSSGPNVRTGRFPHAAGFSTAAPARRLRATRVGARGQLVRNRRIPSNCGADRARDDSCLFAPSPTQFLAAQALRSPQFDLLPYRGISLDATCLTTCAASYSSPGLVAVAHVIPSLGAKVLARRGAEHRRDWIRHLRLTAGYPV
jgi:hypothetical protein